MQSIRGQVALVTGAGKGVGRELVRAFLAEEVHVVAVSRNENDLERLREETTELRKKHGTRLITVTGDVCLEETASAAFHRIHKEFGKLDILVNNAGIARYGPLEELTVEDYDAMMNTNMRSTFLFTKMALPLMKKQRYGHIVNIASVAGLKGLPHETVYCATKFAQVGFAQALDHETREYGIKVSSLCPGGINTNFAMGTGRTPDDPRLKDFLDAKDVADAVLFIVKQEPKSRIIQLFMRPMSEPL